ncbi:MAG: molybdopterin molybdotransferase MoeA [Chloroflexi bacterium]|nr:molybdopterin molybdotransferase MoeA [Chloroflexota bacterium]
MPEFLTLLPPADALKKLLDHLHADPDPEQVDTERALGRILISPVTAPHPLPEFPRAAVDGYAVRAADTFAASESLPIYLELAGEAPMGAAPQVNLTAGKCVLIHTGGMLPEGADAVVMLEYTQPVRSQEIEISRAVAVGENVIEIGEDVEEGQEVIPAGTRLRPAEIGGLMALGFTTIAVARKPKVGLISSGDEVIPPVEKPAPGQVRDINAYTLSAAVESAGGQPIFYGIIPDTYDDLAAAAGRAKTECDLVVITAGSSASARDLTSQILDELGRPGVLVHGVNTRPGKPTILAVCDGVPVIGLPGNPVSALVNAHLFVNPVIKALLGERTARPWPSVRAFLTVNLPSQAGREDWVPVRLIYPSLLSRSWERGEEPGEGGEGYLAEPIFGKSNLIFTLARADGLLKIPPDATGLPAGELVEVYLM